MSTLWHGFFNQSTDRQTVYTALALGAIGGVILPELSNLTSWIRFYFLRSSKLRRYQQSAGSNGALNSSRSWALVTGASDGIGYGFVQELAANNFNVILHGRNQAKVDGLIAELQQQYPHLAFESFICSAIDRAVWSDLDELAESVRERKLPLTVLVNNVGGNPLNGKSFAELAEYTSTEASNLVDMNAMFPLQITRALLPVLSENKPALIVNMSSAVGLELMNMPYLVAYSACKIFNRQFSKTLGAELALAGHSDIDVASIVTGTVQSGGMKTDTSFFVPSSKTFAASTLRLAGNGREEYVGYWPHSLQLWVMSVLPTWLRKRFLAQTVIDLKKEFDLKEGKSK